MTDSYPDMPIAVVTKEKYMDFKVFQRSKNSKVYSQLVGGFPDEGYANLAVAMLQQKYEE